MIFVITDKEMKRELGYIVVDHKTVNGRGITAQILNPLKDVKHPVRTKRRRK